MTDMIMGSVLDGADDLLSSENCGSEPIRKKQKTRRRSIAKCDPGSDDEAPEGEVMPSVGILQNADPEIHRETMAPAVGFEPTTNRLTADRSTTELRWIDLVLLLSAGVYLAHSSGGRQ